MILERSGHTKNRLLEENGGTKIHFWDRSDIQQFIYSYFLFSLTYVNRFFFLAEKASLMAGRSSHNEDSHSY
jgi:hypothetical protein